VIRSIIERHSEYDGAMILALNLATCITEGSRQDETAVLARLGDSICTLCDSVRDMLKDNAQSVAELLKKRRETTGVQISPGCMCVGPGRALSTRGHSTACVQRPRSSVEAALDLGKASFVTRSANGSTASEADLVWNRWRSTRACVPIDALAGARTVVRS